MRLCMFIYLYVINHKRYAYIPMIPLTCGGCDLSLCITALGLLQRWKDQRQTGLHDGKSQTKLLMRCLWENSHLKHNNSNGEHFFIVFFTLKAMPGRIWELCQVRGEPQISGMCLVSSSSVKLFTATAYSSVPSNGGKRLLLTTQTLLLDVGVILAY